MRHGRHAILTAAPDVADTAHCTRKTEYTDVLVKSRAGFLKHTSDRPG